LNFFWVDTNGIAVVSRNFFGLVSQRKLEPSSSKSSWQFFSARQRCDRKAEHVVGVFPETTMTKPDDPAKLTSDQRLAELAKILADGFLRLRQREASSSLPAKPPDKKARKSCP
jgi:hypothetical protein